MNFKNLRAIEKALTGDLTPREKKYLEKIKNKDPGLIEQLDDFGKIRRIFSGVHYHFTPVFADSVMNAIEQKKGIPVTVLFADIIQRAFLRVAVAGVGLLLVLITLFSINHIKHNEQYPVEMLLTSQSLLFDYYYYEMN